MKNKASKGYYHCPQCDMLFESLVKPRADLLCPECGNQPSALRSKVAAHSFSDQLANPNASDLIDSDIGLNIQNARIKKVRGRLWVSITLLVALLTAGIVFNLQKSSTKKEAEELTSKSKVEEENAHTSEEFQDLVANFNELIVSFIRESNQNKLGKFIYNPTRLASQVRKYYQENPLLIIGNPKAGVAALSYIRDEEPYVFGGIFKNEAGEEHEFSLIQYGAVYKMDWPFYVRYNEYSLDDFLENLEEVEADFRLYMRVLDLDDGVSLVFYPPKTDAEGGFDGVTSSSIELPKDDTRVTHMMSMLNSEDREDIEFRDYLKGRDPDGYERVRVRLRLKIDEKKGNSLELIKFIANDWYCVDITNMN